MNSLDKMGFGVILSLGTLMLLGVVSLGFFLSIASGEIAGAAILGSIWRDDTETRRRGGHPAFLRTHE